MGVANALFAYEGGVRVIDGSAAGLGGCPFAPGATGNTATEDIIYAFENGGIPTGVDLGKLLLTAVKVSEIPSSETSGRVRMASLRDGTRTTTVA